MKFRFHEPFGQLDAQTRMFMQHETVRIWEQEKRTVIFVTNNIDEALFLGDRISEVALDRTPAPDADEALGLQHGFAPNGAAGRLEGLLAEAQRLGEAGRIRSDG